MNRNFLDQFSKLQFIFLKRDISGQNGIKLKKDIELPIIENEELNLKNIVEAILFLYGIHDNYLNKEYYRNIILEVDNQKSGVKFLPISYLNIYDKKALIMALGLINLNLDDETTYLTIIESSNRLYFETKESYYLDIFNEYLCKAKEKYDIWQIDYQMAIFEFNSKNYENAIELFSIALKKCDVEEFKEEIIRLIELSNVKIDYQRAIDLFNKNRYNEALVIFESLKEDMKEDEELENYINLSTEKL